MKHMLFVYAMRSPVTKDTYLRRFRIFFNHIQILSMRKKWTSVVMSLLKSKIKQDWAFCKILQFLQFQKSRVENEEISPATLRNFVKTIKLFTEMTDIDIPWKKITRGLPKVKRYADDRAPTLTEISEQ